MSIARLVVALLALLLISVGAFLAYRPAGLFVPGALLWLDLVIWSLTNKRANSERIK